MAIASMGIAANAQTDNNRQLIDECQRLHSDGEYTTALTLIRKIDAEALRGNEKQEFELLKALATFEDNHLEGRSLLLQYLADYPESAKRSLIASYIGNSYFYGMQFNLGCEWFGNSEFNRLS